MRIRPASIALIIYLLLLMLPIYWMVNMSLRNNADILTTFSLIPTLRRSATTPRSSPTRPGTAPTSTRSST